MCTVHAVVDTLDVGDGLSIHVRGRGFVGYVYPHDVFAGEFACLIRLVLLDGTSARPTPGVPEVYQHNFTLVRSDVMLKQHFTLLTMLDVCLMTTTVN